VTLALVGLCLLLACAGEPVTRHLAWDRGALLDGQLWRLWTGHLVHFGASHALADALALGAAGVLVEPWMGSRRYACGLFVSAALVSVALLPMSALDEYRGASSMAMLAAAMACVLAGRRHPALRLPLAAAALALGVKTLYEALGHPGLPSSLPAGIAVAWQAHALGAALGVALAYIPLKRAW
jgi:rhomboid family GlyGly-CTERM serine protease